MFTFLEDYAKSHRESYLRCFKKAKEYAEELTKRPYSEYSLFYSYRVFRENVQDAKKHFQKYLDYKKFDGVKAEKEIIELLDFYFPGRYDIQENNIILHFPEVTITDGYGKSRCLTDIFLRINVDDIFGERIWVRGTRMSHTAAELRCRYSHSHFATDAHNNWADVCFGDFDFKVGGLIETLTMLFMNLQQFLETESTFTTPYCTLSSIGNFENQVSPRAGYSFKNTKITYDLEIEYWEGLPMFVPVDNQKLDLYLMDHYDNAVVFKSGEDYYYRSNSTTAETFSRASLEFQGKQIEWKLNPAQEEAPKTVINPFLKQQFIQYAKYEITKDISISSLAKDSTSSVGEPVSEDTVSVQ